MSDASSVRTTTTRTIVALLVVGGLLPLLALMFTPYYQTNDDVAMRLLAEGNFVPGDEPLPFLMFMNIVIGKLLAFAYGIAPAIPWYDLFLGASLTAASVAIVACWTGSGKASEIATAAIGALFFLLPAFVSVQFSVAGLTCAAAGLGVLTLTFIDSERTRERRRTLLALGMALFVLGSLIRFEGAILIAIEYALLIAPVAIARWKNGTGRRNMTGSAFAAIAAIALAILLFLANQLAYRANQGWRDFYEYNLLRSRLSEYITPERLNPETTSRLATQVGWSETDFAMFRNWFFTDPELYSLARIRHAERLFYGAANKPAGVSWKARKEQSIQLARSFFAEAQWAFLLMITWVLSRGARPKSIFYLLWVALTLVCLVIAIGLALKAPPPRIFWPMLIMAATLLPVVTPDRAGRTHWAPSAAAAAILAIFALSRTTSSLWKEAGARRAAADVVREDVAGLRRTGASMFVLHAHAFPYEDHWRPLHHQEAAFDFVGLGASARTPPVVEFLRRTHRTDLPWAICSDPTMLIIADPYLPPMLGAFVAEHHGVAVNVEPAFRGERFTAWKCRSQRPIGD